MGAQTGDKGWYELPFWRMVKYVFYGFLTGAFIGILGTVIALCISYPELSSFITTSITTFLYANWWLIPSTLAILVVITVLVYLNHKKKNLLRCPYHMENTVYCPYPICIGTKCTLYPRTEVNNKNEC
jgi:hypothetical protein